MKKPEQINHNCTTACMAEQLDIPLWKAMELGKYFNDKHKQELDIQKQIYKEVITDLGKAKQELERLGKAFADLAIDSIGGHIISMDGEQVKFCKQAIKQAISERIKGGELK